MKIEINAKRSHQKYNMHKGKGTQRQDNIRFISLAFKRKGYKQKEYADKNPKGDIKGHLFVSIDRQQQFGDINHYNLSHDRNREKRTHNGTEKAEEGASAR
ncbi:MAG: hypothetical protein MJZ28_12230 [Paludibacteraceae bacterium]|nr:hypothetical protein [Paludibacteraceae bacterium]